MVDQLIRRMVELPARAALLVRGVVGNNPQAAGRALSGSSSARQGTISQGSPVPRRNSGAGDRPVPMTLQELMMEGYSFAEALGMLASGGGGGGYGGGGGGYGGGGGGGFIDTAARDAALANVASTYGTAAATFTGSEPEYRKIHGDERQTTTDATANVRAGAEQAAKAALASRAAERRALGIEDAAAVVSDTVANEQKIAQDNATRTDERMATRTQGHLDNALKFNTDLKAVVELEGKEKQKQIADYYAGQLAQISARRGGGGGGGSRRSSGGSRSSGPSFNTLLNYGKARYNEQLGQYESRYGMQDRQNVYNQTGGNLSLSKWLAGNTMYGRKI